MKPKFIKLVAALWITFFAAQNGLFAQKTFNINDNATNAVLRASTPEVAVNEVFGKALQTRPFSLNQQLRSLTAQNKGDFLTLDFFDNKQYKAVIQQVTNLKNGDVTITSKIEGSATGFMIMSVTKQGVTLSANIPETDDAYILELKNGKPFLSQYRISDLDKYADPCKDVTSFNENINQSLRAATSACSPNYPSDEDVTIKVLFLYTPAADQYANANISGGINGAINTALEKANLVHDNSLTKVHLVYAGDGPVPINYTEFYDANMSPYQNMTSTDLDTMTYNRHPAFDNIPALRKQLEADLVCLVAKYDDGTGGLAWRLNSSYGYENGDPGHGYSIVRVQQISLTGMGGYTVVHELGHNMGCFHHPLQGSPQYLLFPYSNGWRGTLSNGNNASTVMTYETIPGYDGYYPNIPYFSSPNITYPGTTTPIGNAEESNNALTIRYSKSVISLYGEILNTSLTNLTVSSGTLSPVFSSDVYEYNVSVGYGVDNITITGTPNYDCAVVTGDGAKSLAVGNNSFTVQVRSHKSSVYKTYTINIVRLPDACASYQSAPIFSNDNITDVVGSDVFNLCMSAALPAEQRNSFTVDFVGSVALKIRDGQNSYGCYNFGSRNSGFKKILVSKTGSYTFNTGYNIFSLYNSETPLCESFINSTLYYNGSNASFTYGFSQNLQANTVYYIRDYQSSSEEPTSFSITNTIGGTCYEVSDIPYGIDYTYIAVSNADNKIKVQSETGDFRGLTPGTYTIYGAPYSSVGNDPSTFVGKTLSEISTSDCVIQSSTSMTITVTADEYRWTPQTNSTSWTSSNNWTPAGIPTGTSIVTIPQSATYPVLTSSEAATAKDIIFEPGAEIGRQDYLTYERAFVQLDLNRTTARNKWHSISVPFKEMFYADFNLGGLPKSWLDRLEVNSSESLEWIFENDYSKKYSLGDPISVWFDTSDADNSTVIKGLNATSNDILELPFVGNPRVDADVHYNQSYTAPTHIVREINSTFEPQTTGTTTTFSRSNAGDTYKLADAKVVTQTLNFGSTNYVYVGNPFMSSINFHTFANQFTSTFKGNYRIWVNGGSNGKGYAGYEVGTGSFGFGAGTAYAPGYGRYIKPMTGFILERSTSNTSTLPVTIQFGLEKIGATNASSSEGEEPSVNTNLLKIDLSNVNASWRTSIAIRENGRPTVSAADVTKFITAITETPEIYSFKPADVDLQTALDVNILGPVSGKCLIPLGIRTSFLGDMDMLISGMDSFDANVSLIDTYEPKTIDLTGKTDYKYHFVYFPLTEKGKVVDNKDRFFILLAPKNVTGLNQSSAQTVVLGLNGAIKAVSTSEIRSIAVYTLQGTAVYSNPSVGALETRIDGLAQGVYLVKVTTGDAVRTAKVIVK
ncbi:MAG: M12 family metallo-peptidase [Dysgonamonadaceae bacterium]|jgi:hypothetical protein|nr:M12 family metallo-peptidase [Dysgonamonadaceae bacterium]